MTSKLSNARAAMLRKLEAWLHWYRLRRTRRAHDAGYAARIRRQQPWIIRRGRFELKRQLPLLRRFTIGLATVAAIIALVIGGLWWRLANGPIALDIVTPWLTSSIEKNLGGAHRIEVGGTILERDAKGRTALRLRDIILRNSGGDIIATAPRAEIGVSGVSLLLANPRVVSFLLVGANMDIMVQPDGHVKVFAGGQLPFVSLAPVSDDQPASTSPPPQSQNPFSFAAISERGFEKNLTALLGWVDGLGALGRDGKAVQLTGFDGQELIEVGIKNGALFVDDARNQRQWTFSNVTASLTRPEQGGVAFNASSESEERSWSLTASLMPLREGRRAFRFEAHQVMLDHLLLALQLGDGQFYSTLPINADIRAEIAPDGAPQTLRGRIAAAGYIGDEKAPEERIPIDFADIRLDWDLQRGTLLSPIELKSGANRLMLYAQLTPPAQRDGIMTLTLDGGSVVLGPLAQDREPLVLNNIAVQIRHDLARQLVELERANIGADGAKGVGLAISGKLDYSRDDPQLSLGLVGTQMTVSALKRLWPTFVAPHVRSWIMQHLFRGYVERLDLAINTPWSTLPASGPPMTDDALAIDVVINNVAIRPVDGLPAIRDGDLATRVTGRTATVKLNKGIVDISPGRRLAVSNVLFEIPEMHSSAPPARVRFKLDGPVPAAAELMASEKLRDMSGPLLDPATSRGTISAQILLNLPLARELPKDSVSYNLSIDLTNFSAERMIMNKKVEAALLRVTATNQSYAIKGDVKIDGTPAQLEYKRASGETEADVRIAATLDDTARARLGFDFGGAVIGSVPVKVSGRIPANARDAKYSVEADFTAARIDNLVPGWIKAPGRPMRATFSLSKTDQTTRLEDIFVDGSGAMLRGTLDVDANGELQSVNFPTFGLADGDKASLKVDRTPEGLMRVVLRGDILDVRSFVKSSMSGSSPEQKQKAQRDLDLDLKISRVLGHNGEALRSVDLKLMRRGGQLRAFALNATLGRDSPIKGDMRELKNDARDPRARGGNNQVLYLETNDAGALFRLTDIYPRMSGGRLWIVMDPPGNDLVPQEGVLNIRDFSVSGDQQLQGVLASQPNAPRDNIVFASLYVEFTRTSGTLTIRDGVVRGPVLGLTIDGGLDYRRDEVRLRGTIVPLYGLNNALTQIPIVGPVLGGGDNKSGVFAWTYEVVGTPNQPEMRVNPVSALAPGLFRKIFEFPAANSTANTGTNGPNGASRPGPPQDLAR